MEIQLRLRINSGGLVLETKQPSDIDWEAKILVEKKGQFFRIYSLADSHEIVFLKQYEKVSKKERLIAKDPEMKIVGIKTKYSDHLLDNPWWHLELNFYGDSYSLRHVGSGIKGDIVPVVKNGEAVAVFSVSNLSIGGKRRLSLYTNSPQDIIPILFLYLTDYINRHRKLDTNMLNVHLGISYRLTGRKYLTKKHLSLIPEEMRPTKIEAIIWHFIVIIPVVLIGFLRLNSTTLFSILILLFYFSDYFDWKPYRKKQSSFRK